MFEEKRESKWENKRSIETSPNPCRNQKNAVYAVNRAIQPSFFKIKRGNATCFAVNVLLAGWIPTQSFLLSFLTRKKVVEKGIDKQMLRALVIVSNDKTVDMGDILAIARSQAQKREHTHENVNVKSILYDPVTGSYVVLYEAGCSREADVSLGRKDTENE